MGLEGIGDRLFKGGSFWETMDKISYDIKLLEKDMEKDVSNKNGSVTITEDEIIMLVPGFCKDDFLVTVTGKILTIEGKNDEHGEVTQDFILNRDVSDIEITVLNGILTAKMKTKPSDVNISIS